MVAFPKVWLCKIGISGGVSYRRKRISESMFGFVVPVWIVSVPFAWQIEQWLHRVFSFANMPQKGVSGGTEFFSVLILPFAWIILTIIQLIWWGILLATALFVIWVLAGFPKI